MTTERIHNQIKSVVQMAHRQFGFDIPFEQISINIVKTGVTAGVAWKRNNQYGINISEHAYQLDPDNTLHDTIPHEIAHLVCFHNPNLGKNHNNGWKRVCQTLGGSGQRTHNLRLAKTKYQTVHLYKLPNNHELLISSRVHRNIQKGDVYKTKKSHVQILPEFFQRTLSSAEHKQHYETQHNIQSKPTSKIAQCRAVFNPNTSRQNNIKSFMEFGCSQACAATYYNTIKKEHS